VAERPTARPASRRFREVDAYRAHREWLRYEGTGQRDLYRQLRERFLLRHASGPGWVLDLGSGPGRFLPFVGQEESRRVALDLSREMLALVPDAWTASGAPGAMPDRVLGNALRAPFVRGRWAEVIAIGNMLGFAGREAEPMLGEAEDLVAPGGKLVIEIAPGPGERSKYLARLPPKSAARLLRAPKRVVLARLDREGFRTEEFRRAPRDTFRRFSVAELENRYRRKGWSVADVESVAPLLGPDSARAAAVRTDDKAWWRLLELEEEVGRRPERWPEAAAVLLCVQAPTSDHTIK